MLTKNQSNMFYAVKTVAVLLIVGAHMSVGRGHLLAEGIRVSICQIGVAVFFVCTGFFYKREENDSKSFWLKKFKTIIVPWMNMATATFLLSVILSGTANGFPISYIKWVFGVGSHYWYLTVMVVCFVLFKYVLHDGYTERTKSNLLYLCIGISLLSVSLSVVKVIVYNADFNQYTNVLNWIGWFSLGVLVRQKKWLNRLVSLKLFAAAFPLLIGFVMLSAKRGIEIQAYVDIFSIPIEVCGGICVLFIAKLLCNSKVLVDVGKKSFFIYLVHIQIAGVINSHLPYNTVFFVARPFIAVAVCYSIAKIFEWILKKIKCSQELRTLLALR